MIEPLDFYDQVAATTESRLNLKKQMMGYIDYDYDPSRYPSEWPRVHLDGQGLSERTYPCISSYTPRPGDRVYLAPKGSGHIIMGAVLDTPNRQLLPGTLVFKAASDANQSIAVATSFTDPILWTLVPLDLLGGWVGDTGFSGGDFRGRWSPPVPGWYKLSGASSWSTNANGWRANMWRVNGATIQGGFSRTMASSTGTSQSHARTVSVYLNGVGDYVELCVGHGPSGTSPATLALTAASTDVLPHIEITYVGPGSLTDPLPNPE